MLDGKKLRRARERRHFTQQEMVFRAYELGLKLSMNTISGLERGKLKGRKQTIETLQILARVLGVKADDLLSDEPVAAAGIANAMPTA